MSKQSKFYTFVAFVTIITVSVFLWITVKGFMEQKLTPPGTIAMIAILMLTLALGAVAPLYLANKHADDDEDDYDPGDGEEGE